MLQKWNPIRNIINREVSIVMCILFIYNGGNDVNSDYSLILVSNRDEFYMRPALIMAPWNEDPDVYGGRDLEPGCNNGTWLAVNRKHQKVGVLLNLPGDKKENAKSRGTIIADYAKTDASILDYINHIKEYTNECNGFIFVSVEYKDFNPKVITFNNETDDIVEWYDLYLGFSNSLPNEPLKKVQAGTNMLRNICSKFNEIASKKKLIEELLNFLKNEQRNLPDTQLETRQPKIYKELSSIFVKIPEIKYGTRAHTILLVSKTGCVDLIEISMRTPYNEENPHWERHDFQFENKLQ